MQHQNKFRSAAIVLTLAVAAQAAAHAADLFQMKEVAGHGQQIAAADSKCGKGSCGAAKAAEKKAAEEKAAHKCAAGKKACTHKCGGKKGHHKCASVKGHHKTAVKKETSKVVETEKSTTTDTTKH